MFKIANSGRHIIKRKYPPPENRNKKKRKKTTLFSVLTPKLLFFAGVEFCFAFCCCPCVGVSGNNDNGPTGFSMLPHPHTDH